MKLLNYVQFYKNSTGQLSCLAFQLSSSEHSWQSSPSIFSTLSSIKIYTVPPIASCMMLTKTGGRWLTVNPKHCDYQLSIVLTLVNVTNTTRL